MSPTEPQSHEVPVVVVGAGPSGLTAAAEDEVVSLCRDLLRIDSSNPTSNERAAAEQVAEWLTDAGLTPEIYESAPGRASTVARWAGEIFLADRRRARTHNRRPPRPRANREFAATRSPGPGRILSGMAAKKAMG